MYNLYGRIKFKFYDYFILNEVILKNNIFLKYNYILSD